MPAVFTTGTCRVPKPPDPAAVARKAQTAELFSQILALRGEELQRVRRVFSSAWIGGPLLQAIRIASLLEQIEHQLARLPPGDPGREILEQLHQFYREESP